MRVLLHSSLFTASRSTVGFLLETLLQLGLDGRHILELANDAEAAFNAWRAGRDAATQEQADFALGRPAKQAALMEPARELVVCCDTTGNDWNNTPPRIQLAEALDFLRQPLRLLLEDNASDWHFILSFTTPQQREFLLGRKNSKALLVEHGGGVTKMAATVTGYLNDRRPYWHLFVIFDSDALQPHLPSKQTVALYNLCVGGKREATNPPPPAPMLPFHRLNRRFVENYLTKAALDIWATETSFRPPNPPDASIPQNVVDAYMAMQPAQRHHYNLKEGFSGDVGRIQTGETTGTLYDGLDATARTLLKYGMKGSKGGKLAALYEPRKDPTDSTGNRTLYLVTEPDLRADGSWEEINKPIRNLLAHLC